MIIKWIDDLKLKMINFDEKIKLTNVFEKIFDNDKIQKNYVNFKKQFTQIIDQIKTKKLKKQQKYNCFNWIAYYDNECLTYRLNKKNSKWFFKKFKKTRQSKKISIQWYWTYHWNVISQFIKIIQLNTHAISNDEYKSTNVERWL